MRSHLTTARAGRIAFFLIACGASAASASGMFFDPRGARPLGRAGAFVAGADDLGALYYNPAGISGTGSGSVLLDVGLVMQSVDYDRVDSGGNALPRASDNNKLLPIPTLGVSFRPEALGRRWTFAFGVFAPYSGIQDFGNQTAMPPDYGPQRYSLVSLNGTALAVAELATSLRITPELYVGIGLQDMYVSLHNLTVLSGCASELNCAPEDPNFDAPTQSRVSSLFVPSANFGLLVLQPKFRVGASLQLPYFVHASGTVTTRLPSDPQFRGATVTNDQHQQCGVQADCQIDVDFTLPLVARLGFELRPTHELRVELAGTYAAWSMQDAINFTPIGVHIEHVVGIGTYDLKPMSIVRKMQDSIAVHLGGEYDLANRRVTLRAGYMYETSAVPDQTMTVLTPDGDKHILTVGASLRLGGAWRLDAGYAHAIQPDRTVTNSQSLQLNPVQPGIAVPVGNGTYHVQNDVVSLGVEARF